MLLTLGAAARLNTYSWFTARIMWVSPSTSPPTPMTRRYTILRHWSSHHPVEFASKVALNLDAAFGLVIDWDFPRTNVNLRRVDPLSEATWVQANGQERSGERPTRNALGVFPCRLVGLG